MSATVESFPDESLPLPDEGKSSTLAPNSAARRLVEALVARGVSTFFGIPGGPVCPVFEAIRVTKGARLVESRHETAAAFAAATYHRASGQVPAVVVTAGPGITNAVTGIASAYLERIPMLVIAGDVAWATNGGRLAQDSGLEGLNIDTMLSPVIQVCIRAWAARSVVPQAMAALDAAKEGSRPALFVLPLDHALGEAPAVQVTSAPPKPATPPDPTAIVQVMDYLLDAKRPLLVIGGGCRRHLNEVKALVERLQIPFVTTPRAKGFVSEGHPLSLRNGGMAASSWAVRYTTERPVDFCLALGTDLDDSSVASTPYCGTGGTLVHVDTDAAVFGRNIPTQLGVVADVGVFATALAAFALKMGRADLLSEIKRGSPFQRHQPTNNVHPAEALLRLEAKFPAARFITDIGEHMLFALHYLTATRPGAFSIQLNLGSMGSGISGAIGLSLGSSGPVVAIVGDGGMQMHGMEALVAIREKLPILFAVFNDGRYNMVHHGMRQIFGEADSYATPPIDFDGWARSIGLPSHVIFKASDLDDVRFEAKGPMLLDIRIDPSMHMSGGGRIAALQRMSMTNTKRTP